MNINKGMFRIYIVASILWSAFFLKMYDTYGGNDVLIMIILPLPLYFVLKWILKGFE